MNCELSFTAYCLLLTGYWLLVTAHCSLTTAPFQILHQHQRFPCANNFALAGAGGLQVDEVFIGAQAGDGDGGHDGLVQVSRMGEGEGLFEPVGAAAGELGSEQAGEKTGQQGARDDGGVWAK